MQCYILRTALSSSSSLSLSRSLWVRSASATLWVHSMLCTLEISEESAELVGPAEAAAEVPRVVAGGVVVGPMEGVVGWWGWWG